MDTDVALLMTEIAKVGEGVVRIDEKIDDLKEVSVVRLNDHAVRVRSLELTRARQWGAAKVAGMVGGALGSLAAYLKFWNQ